MNGDWLDTDRFREWLVEYFGGEEELRVQLADQGRWARALRRMVKGEMPVLSIYTVDEMLIYMDRDLSLHDIPDDCFVEAKDRPHPRPKYAPVV